LDWNFPRSVSEHCFAGSINYAANLAFFFTLSYWIPLRELRASPFRFIPSFLTSDFSLSGLPFLYATSFFDRDEFSTSLGPPVTSPPYQPPFLIVFFFTVVTPPTSSSSFLLRFHSVGRRRSFRRSSPRLWPEGLGGAVAEVNPHSSYIWLMRIPSGIPLRGPAFPFDTRRTMVPSLLAPTSPVFFTLVETVPYTLPFFPFFSRCKCCVILCAQALLPVLLNSLRFFPPPKIVPFLSKNTLGLCRRVGPRVQRLSPFPIGSPVIYLFSHFFSLRLNMNQFLCCLPSHLASFPFPSLTTQSTPAREMVVAVTVIGSLSGRKLASLLL